MGLAGRSRERALLAQVMASSEAELVAVYGRRRVGKTYMIRELLGDAIRFELTAVNGASVRDQLANFATALAVTRGSVLEPPASWRAAFEQLAAALKSRSPRKRVLFFDELPWLASRRSGFLPAFEHFWNSWAVKQHDLVIVVCGSAAAWMIQHLARARGGLHNRVTRRIRLEPFTLAETEAYFTSRSMSLGRHQILELYAALGGVPYYLKQIERGDSAGVAIDRTCFARDGALRDEFPKLYASLFEHADRHVQIVRALGGKPRGLTRNELIDAAGLTSGGGTSRILDELEESGFILRTPQLDRPIKDAVVRLIDEYSLFYLKWIEGHRGSADNIWINKRGSSAWRAWSGYAFEGICLKHIASLKRALGIEAVETTERAWHHRPVDRDDRGAQIDLVIDRRDASINLCEMKFSDGEVTIDKAYAGDLRHKRDTFRRVTGSRKTLLVTLITTHGLRNNQYARELVDKALTMDALFLL
jgi:AAA+ ATPase superfamily predicted ATPase